MTCDTPKDGGSAFPYALPDSFHPAGHMTRQGGAENGMTLRDWFAGQAIPGLEKTELSVSMAAHLLGIDSATYRSQVHWPKVMARMAYNLADAMIAERGSK